MRLSFDLGSIVATPGALLALERADVTAAEYLRKHACLEKGDLCDEDHELNLDAVEHGERILSSFRLPESHERIWIITEADRSVTTLLLPEEY